MKTCILFAMVALWFGAAQAQEQGGAAIYPQLGHSGGIHAIAFSPDGRYLASGVSDKMIRLWDVKNGREVRTLVGHSEVVSAVAFSPDGKLLATGDWDRIVTLWDVASGRSLRTFGGGTGVVWSLAFSPDGKSLAFAASDRIPSDVVAEGPDPNAHTIELWDVSGGAKRSLFSGAPNYTASIAFSPDGKVLAGAGADGMLWWNVASGRVIRTIAGTAKPFSTIAFSPNGRVLASGGSNGVTLWNAANGRALRKFSGLYDEVTSVAFSPNGKMLATGSYDQTVSLWDASRGRVLHELVAASGINGTHVAFSPDGKMLASVAEQTVDLWDPGSGKTLQTLGRHTANVESVALSPDRKVIASGRDDKTIALWDAATGRELRTLAGHTNFIESLAFSPDGSVLASAAADDTVRLWDVAKGFPLRTLNDPAIGVSCMAFSPDGTLLASGSNIGGLVLWDAASGREVRKLPRSGAVAAVAFSPDGKSLATVGGSDAAIKLWDVAGGTLLRTMTGRLGENVEAVAFSPDGTVLAAAGTDKTITLWDVASGSAVRTLSGHSDWVGSLAFSPKGDMLASGSSDNSVKLWDVASGRTLRTLDGHLGIVTSVVFASDGTMLVSGSWDGTVRVWDVASGRPRASLIAFDDGSSIAATPEGFFDSSSEQAEENLNVRIGGRVFGIASFREHFYRPDLVERSLAGGALTQFGSIDSVKLSPVVEFADVPASTTKSSLNLTLRLTDGGGGFGPVRLFWNGTIIQQDSDLPLSGDIVTRPYTVPLFPGSNDLRVSALNADGTMFSDASVSVSANLPAPKKIANARGTLHAVIVGIQHFPNAPGNELVYPDADAQLIAQTLRDKAAPLFAKLDIRLLKPEETDKLHVTRALAAMQSAVGPDDAFVFYVASHGTLVGGEYYLMTSDAASLDPASLGQHAISRTELLDLLANIHAAKKLVIIDTCDAGNVMTQPGEPKAQDSITVLGRSGLAILAATTSDQEALEGGYKDHGLFTYVVADGLAGRAADTASGIVSSFLLADYVSSQVPVLAETVLHRTQQPTADKSGQAFAITKVK